NQQKNLASRTYNNNNRNIVQQGHSSPLPETPGMSLIATGHPEYMHNSIRPDDEPKQAIPMKEQEEAEKSTINATGETVLSNKPASATLIGPRWKVTLETEGYQPLALKRSERVQQRSASYKMLEAGINYYNPVSDAASGFNFHMGVKYCFNIAPRLSLATGVSYSRQHQGNGKRTYNTISYGFGENRETIGINTIRLDYLEVPLSLFYSIKGRHGLITGVSCNYLVQSADLVKQANEISYKEKSTGYYAAFNRFDVQLHAGYTYTLNSHILVSAAYYAGITDVTKNSAFRSGEFNTNKGLRLTLGYQLY
ncbi:MAG: outer membrane beta-barrel protein, partial [Bacteroidota bacterium]